MKSWEPFDTFDTFVMARDELKRQEKLKADQENEIAERELKEKTDEAMKEVDWNNVSKVSN